jgi:hypothetical protein
VIKTDERSEVKSLGMFVYFVFKKNLILLLKLYKFFNGSFYYFFLLDSNNFQSPTGPKG